MANHLVDFLVQLRYFLLLGFELFAEIFLFALELFEHGLLLAFVSFEVLLLAFAGVEGGQFVMFVSLQQFVLGVYLRLCMFYTTDLFLTECRKLLEVTGSAR